MPGFNWTPQRLEILKERLAAGDSYREVGVVLGISKEQVSRKVKRMRLKPGRIPGGQVPKKPDGVIREPQGPFVRLIDLEAHHCRDCKNERDEDGLNVYCGAPKVVGSSYCKFHTEIYTQNLRS
jgi:hypothetical protein